MNTFANAVKNQTARTANGMKARSSTANAAVDLFFKIGASRGKDITSQFSAAYAENRDYALRIAQWARDIREGSGERKLFRDILVYLDKHGKSGDAISLLRKAPELGRWDDLLVDFTDTRVRDAAFDMILAALNYGDGLCAKWMPRKGSKAVELRNYFGWTPKFYRKRLVELTKVVEQDMCANNWDDINFNHVPSVASSRYKKAFNRHTPKYAEWTTKLVSDDPEVKASVKINAGAVYPYDVLKGHVNHYMRTNFDKNELNAVLAQWEALPDFIGDASIVPIVDVSGSMSAAANAGPGNRSGLTCLDVAVSLGLYIADKNKGAFKDIFINFSDSPQIQYLRGNTLQKVEQMVKSQWDMSTNLHAAFERLLQVAVDGNVPASEMPKMVLILSDMQFNCCKNYDDSAIQMIRRKYEAAGYEAPSVVFWNINAYDNVPVSFNERGVALVSGFSPSIVKNVLAADLEQFTPEEIMKKTILKDRYNY